jgi:hypothetical protein
MEPCGARFELKVNAMNKMFLRCAIASLVFAGVALGADTLQLRDGRTITGQFIGATRTEVWFQREGQAEAAAPVAIPIGQITSLAFEPAVKPSGLSSQLKPAARAGSLVDWLAVIDISRLFSLRSK